MDVVRFVVLFLMTKKFANAITLTASSNKATVGFDFTFSCLMQGRVIMFLRDGNIECTIIGEHPNGICTLSPGYSTMYNYYCNNSTGVYNLTIPSSFNIDTLHGSNWTCNAPFENAVSTTVQLHVNVPITEVRITSKIPDDNPTGIILNTKRNFTCRTNAGRPSSRIQWYLSGTNISGSASPQADVCISNCKGKVISSSELTYTGIKADNGKRLYCTAVNVIGHSVRSDNKSIIIWYGPSKVTMSPPTQMYIVNESTGRVGPITCIAHECNPTCKVKWNGPNLTGDNSSELDLKNILRNQAGDYFCTATNDAWSMKTVTLSVIVNYGPSEVSINPVTQNYNELEITGHVGPIHCTADCKPACTIQWTGPYITDGTTDVLKLETINRNQSGQYQCNATNIIGSHISVIVNVVVNYGPGLVIITPNTPTYTVKETTEQIDPITCTADCEPYCSMTWNGPNIPDGTTSVLSLKNIDRNQTGNYNCTATNIYGTMTSTTIRVIVTYGPRQVNIFPSNSTYTAIDSIGYVGPISCMADCKPECTLIWNGPNIPEGITSVLHIQNISKIQAGVYSCAAANNIGSLTSVPINVIVNYGPADVIISPDLQHYTVNETDSVNSITCTADCKPSCTMSWTGPNFSAKFPGSATSILKLHNLTRDQSGTYQCHASNNVGSQISLSLTITVNFRPAVNDIFGNRSFSENDTMSISCYVKSVPTAEINWIFEEKILEQNNMFFVHEILTTFNTNYKISTLNISRIGCLSMGTYTCAANNIIGEDMKDIDIDVRCPPRINGIGYNVTKLIAVKDQEPLNITVPIIAYPHPYIYWTFVNNETFVNVTQTTSHIVSKNRVFSSLYIENVTEPDFGHYRLYAVNGIGNTEDYIYSFEVIPERKPNPPDNVTCIGRSSSVLVNWKSNFNGGDTQSFQIFIKKDGSENFYYSGLNYTDPGRNQYLNAAIKQLTTDTTYHVLVHASNKHNISKSELTTCNTTSAVVNEQKKTNIIAIGAGTGITGAIVVLVIVAGVLIFIRRRKIDDKIGQDKELMKRSVDYEEDNDDGIKDNPLYVSSQQEPGGTVYSVVDKKRQNLNKGKGKLSNENTIYTEVVKSNKKELKNKGIEMGYVYQNTGDINPGETDDVYANSDVKGHVGDNQVHTPTKNKDGLIYADLDLASTMSGKRFVIRGLENRNNYAVIDLIKTAEPLPSDSDSDDDKTKMTTEEE